jgi:DNA-binding response OmpR family regulator
MSATDRRHPIIIAESNFLTARLLAASLQGARHPIAIGRDGDQAIKLLELHGARTLVLNMNLSRPSGLEFLRSLRQRRPDVQVLAITAPGQSELRAAARSLGISEFFEIPFSPEELVRRVERMLA